MYCAHTLACTDFIFGRIDHLILDAGTRDVRFTATHRENDVLSPQCLLMTGTTSVCSVFSLLVYLVDKRS